MQGENISQTAPTVTVTGSISGGFTVYGGDIPDDLGTTRNLPDGALNDYGYVTQSEITDDNSSTVARVDHDRIIRYDYNIGANHVGSVPVIVGTATITITPAAGTHAHYTLSGKAPHSKGRYPNVNPVISDRDRSATWIYTAPFTLKQNRPGVYTPTILKVRAYLIAPSTDEGVTTNKVAPNDKSKLMHIRFLIQNPSL